MLSLLEFLFITTCLAQGSSGGDGSDDGGGDSSYYSDSSSTGNNCGEPINCYGFLIFIGGLAILGCVIGIIIKVIQLCYRRFCKRTIVKFVNEYDKNHTSLSPDVKNYMKNYTGNIQFTGNFKGTSEINKGEHHQTIIINHDNISASPIVSFNGSASDKFGESKLDGLININNGKIAWNKNYNTHSVEYYGLLTKNNFSIIISGEWIIDDTANAYDSGTFELTHNLPQNIISQEITSVNPPINKNTSSVEMPTIVPYHTVINI